MTFSGLSSTCGTALELAALVKVGGNGEVAVLGDTAGLVGASGAEVDAAGEAALAGGAGEPEANRASSALSAIALYLSAWAPGSDEGSVS